MSDDLVKRARRLDTCIFPNERSKCLCGELADRIEKLEASLQRIASCESHHPDDVVAIARKALEGKDD